MIKSVFYHIFCNMIKDMKYDNKKNLCAGVPPAIKPPWGGGGQSWRPQKTGLAGTGAVFDKNYNLIIP